jgi:hypothetical protein
VIGSLDRAAAADHGQQLQLFLALAAGFGGVDD